MPLLLSSNQITNFIRLTVSCNFIHSVPWSFPSCHQGASVSRYSKLHPFCTYPPTISQKKTRDLYPSRRLEKKVRRNQQCKIYQKDVYEFFRPNYCMYGHGCLHELSWTSSKFYSRKFETIAIASYLYSSLRSTSTSEKKTCLPLQGPSSSLPTQISNIPITIENPAPAHGIAKSAQRIKKYRRIRSTYSKVSPNPLNVFQSIAESAQRIPSYR